MMAAAPAAMVVRDKVEKEWEARAVAEPVETIPDDVPDSWGKWRFWNGQWWARAMFQPESQGPSWEAPRAGLNPAWNKLKGVWLKAKREIPKEWRGSRLILEQNGIRGCNVTVFVNRKKVGTIAAPAGELEITPFVAFGAQNEFHLLLVGQNHDFRLEKDPPMLVVKPPVSIDDVFANTSWRKRRLTVETEVTVPKACLARCVAEVFDATGRRVKTIDEEVALVAGTNVLKPSVAWPDPTTWELGRGYLYTLKVKLVVGTKEYAYRDVRFGFREIWREGRKIFMNGHEQKYRVSYNFGCNQYGARFLQSMGCNCIQFAHRTELDPTISEDDLAYFSEQGIAVIEPMCAFDWKTKNSLLQPGEKREAFKKLQARNLKRYRNWPCLAMMYMGVNAYLPQWAYEALHMGAGDEGDFAKMMDDLVAAAKETNPNVLYFSHSDGNTGEIASANLYFNWVPLQEREEWPSRWAECGKRPFQACEFGHPYQYSWYKDGRDLISEYCAIYYGEAAYLEEPESVRVRHKPGLYLRRLQHPLFWKLTEDFYWRTTRAWRTFGVNAGIVWFNLDYGYGMPGWSVGKINNQYAPSYNFFTCAAEIPTERPAWAFPSWDIYRKGNLDFLGWIAGAPRITDRRHAYHPGETIEKQCVMMWDGFETRRFSATWTAMIGERRVAGGEISQTLLSNVPAFTPICFTAPEVSKKTPCELSVAFADASGKVIATDSFAIEIYPKKTIKWSKAPTFALYDPDGKTEAELRRCGLVNMRRIATLAEVKDDTHLVIGAFALGQEGWGALPMDAVEKGLNVLILPQEAAVWSSFGFDVQDRQSRLLFVRDRLSPALRTLDDSDVRDWNGAPRTNQKAAYGLQQHGSLVKHPRHEPRWTYNMSVAALQLRSPDVIGWTPQIEGEFDMNYSALVHYAHGAGSIRFCTLDFLGRIHTGAKETEAVRPATDAAIEKTAAAVFADFLMVKAACPGMRTIVACDPEAKRIAETLGASVRIGEQAGPGEILLVGKDASLSADKVLASAGAGANVLVVCNEMLAKGLGFSLAGPDKGIYLATFDHANPDLRGIGQSQLRWRDRLLVAKLSGGRAGWTIDADGLFASRTLANGAKIFVSQYDPFQLEDRLSSEPTYLVDGKPVPYKDDKTRTEVKIRCDLSFERSHQFTARLLTNLGAKSAFGIKLYTGLVKDFDPYSFTYW